MELNAITAEDRITISADTCIVGAGPVGLVLAQELRKHAGETVVLESGSSEAEQDLIDLNAGEVRGKPYQVLAETRCRGIGGTAAAWNTNLNGIMTAKYVELDQIDFEPRSWVPYSGWPFPKSVLEPYYRRARELVGSVYMKACKTGCGGITFEDGGLVNRSYHFGTQEPFLQQMPEEIRGASDVMLVHGATATRIVTTNGNERVREIHWRTLGGKSGVVQASNFVLAAGGIENAHLLLAAGKLGSGQSKWLGCCFMEHPVDSSLELTTNPSQLMHSFGFYSPHGDEQGKCVMGRVGLSEALMREERLVNASLRLIADAIPRSLADGNLTALVQQAMPFKSLCRWIAQTAGRVGGLPGPGYPAGYQLLLDLEQSPHLENRIILTDSVDHFGIPRVALYWRWHDDDELARQRILSVIAREFESVGVGELRVASTHTLNANSHHHAGATRMHPDPGKGVVDEHLRMHGVENLFVTGSSVFPTAGFANPTLTSIALTLRLGDHLGNIV